MKLITDISEDTYTRLFDNGIQGNEIAVDDVCEMARALRLGTPLPKGHGRLIDADVLVDGMEDDYEFCEVVNATPTIIESDKR